MGNILTPSLTKASAKARLNKAYKLLQQVQEQLPKTKQFKTPYDKKLVSNAFSGTESSMEAITDLLERVEGD